MLVVILLQLLQVLVFSFTWCGPVFSFIAYAGLSFGSKFCIVFKQFLWGGFGCWLVGSYVIGVGFLKLLLLRLYNFLVQCLRGIDVGLFGIKDGYNVFFVVLLVCVVGCYVYLKLI